MQHSNKKIYAFFVVLLTVVINVISSIITKEIAIKSALNIYIRAIGALFIILSMFAVFKLWGFAHKRYPISSTYPLTCIFFPVILAVSYLYGESISFQKVLGTVFVTFGVFWLYVKVE